MSSSLLSDGHPSSTTTTKAAAGGRRSGSRRVSISVRTGALAAAEGAGASEAGDAAAAANAAPFATAASVADVCAGLARLHAREAALTDALQALVARHRELRGDLQRLDSLRAALGAQAIAARAVGSTMLAGAADTAGRLASTVRALDLEKARVEATLRVVEQVAELKACVAGVVGSMGAPQDWEAAAGYLARASRIPAAIVTSGFARAVVPTVEVPDPPAATLEDARASLCGLFLREFERAARAVPPDDARVTRFFKLFPLIGRTDVGLDVYGRYVCQGVAEAARAAAKDAAAAAAAAATAAGGRRDGFVYANALAKLFTHISQIVEGHGVLVERHYGAGQMVKVIARLQAEADVQGGIVLDTWSDERGVDRKLTDVKSYPFSFLVQSFLHLQRGGGGGGGNASGAGGSGAASGAGGSSGIDGLGRSGTPRGHSPAIGGTDADAGRSPRQSEDEGGVNMKEVDGLLSEMTVMLSRWSMYSRFLAGKCRDRDTPDDAPLAVPAILTQSNLQRKIAARLTTPYTLLSTFFFRRSVEKAFQLEEVPADLSLNLHRPIVDSNPPYIVSAVDDVMYIVNAVLQKSMSTLQRDVVAGVVPPVARVLGSDFIGMVQRKMRDEAYPKPAVHGGFPPEDKIVLFVVLINSLDMAMEYLARIVSNRMGVPMDEGGGGGGGGGDDGGGAAAAGGAGSTAGSIAGSTAAAKNAAQRIPSPTAPAVLAHLREAFPFDHDAAAVAATLASLFSSFAATASELQGEGLQVLFNQVVKARLRPVLVDTFRDADYALTDAELAAWAEQAADDGGGGGGGGLDVDDLDLVLGQVPRRFEHGWDALMRPLARLLTPRTFASLADTTAKYLARVLEKRVWGYTGRTSADGAIRLERDVNGIVGAVARGGGSYYGAREVFAKTAQILMVANMEEDEWEELGGGEAQGEDDDGMVWLLSEDERRRARGMVRRG